MGKLILASQSPRRQALLRQMGVEDFSVVIPQAEESYDPGMTPRQIVCHISRRKAETASAMVSAEDIVIAADTMVFLDQQRLGKPHTEEEAAEMLRSLSGREHTVCTGVTVRRGAFALTAAESTIVRFRPLAESEIRWYVSTGECMDKAGAYGIQDKGALLVEGIQGDYFNVMGLPVLLLSRMLLPFGIDLTGKESVT